MTQETPRWQYRFDNYKRAYMLLRQAIETKQEHSLSALETEGVIQRFEYCWELAWKTLKDYLDYSGITIDIITPRNVIKAAFAANIIADGEGWMRALDTRNKMAHVYQQKAFEQAIEAIEKEYLNLFDMLHEFFLEKRVSEHTIL